ncbi:hypothetical protein H0H92_007079 [Tricholoma furcatifolium]|nr:hypothetical protein H0H92_007079 [Tricholoma furcatifolium]
MEIDPDDEAFKDVPKAAQKGEREEVYVDGDSDAAVDVWQGCGRQVGLNRSVTFTIATENQGAPSTRGTEIGCSLSAGRAPRVRGVKKGAPLRSWGLGRGRALFRDGPRDPGLQRGSLGKKEGPKGPPPLGCLKWSSLFSFLLKRALLRLPLPSRKFLDVGVDESERFLLIQPVRIPFTCTNSANLYVGNTNKSNYEVYALLGEFYGSGFPLGYLLIQSHEGAQKGGKERFITHFLNHFKVTWDIRPIVTLTDKDIAEINAFRTVYPDAKHQLCFWHCLRAIKTRLSILRRRPKQYNVLEANKEFSWIKVSFVPIAQAVEGHINTQPVQKAIPRVTVRFQGELKTVAPEPIQHARRLILKLNGRVLSVVSLPSHPILSDTISEAATGRNDADVDAESTSSDLWHQVDEFLDKNSTDQEDGPDWMFDEGEVVAKDPMYVFCPAVHRKQALHLFTKHFCQHPIFLERDGKWDAQKIRNQAVYEMYQYCTHRNLPELWGYMWTSWYSPKMWILWA